MMPAVATTAPSRPRDSLRDRLRRRTADLHHRLETRLDIVARLSDPLGRRALVARFWTLHLGAEAALAPVLEGIAGLDYPSRRRSGRLAADLAVLDGTDPDPAGAIACPFPPLSPGAAFGHLYVLEGSTLGGRVIAREMAAAGRSCEGLSFFEGDGPATGARWRDFLAVLEREGGRDGAAADEILAGAVAGFEQVEAWLCDGTGQP